MNVILEIPTVSEANRASHEHWRVRQKRAKAQREAFRLLWKKHGKPVTLPAIVTFTRFSVRELDSDNLPTAFKHIRDQLAAEIGIDDRDKRVEWRYQQEKGQAGRFRLVIEEKQ